MLNSRNRIAGTTAGLIAGLLAFGVVGQIVQTVRASDPKLTVILPRGVQRGADHTLRFVGARIGDAQEVFLYQPGVTVREIRKVDANQIDVDVTVAADCTIGEHLAQLRTPRGISDYRSFYVGLFPSTDETEPNNTLEEARPIELNVTCAGTVTNEDVDAWSVDLKAGQRLSVEIEALRLGFMFDPHLSILDERRFEVASCDDSPLFRQDGVLSILAPADGKYFIMVRDAAYVGNDNFRYRMHVGDFSRPKAVLPAGGNPGESIAVRFLGDPKGEFSGEVVIPALDSRAEGVFVTNPDGSMTPSLFQIRKSSLPNHIEVAGQVQDWPAESALALPVAINGVIATGGEVDWYLFAGKKDEVWDIETYAQRLGSGCDPVINIFKADRSHIAGNDDSLGADSWMRFTVPEDGNYYLRIRDHLSRGQADFFYRVEMDRVKPALSVSIPRIDRYRQTLQNISVPQGNRFATVLNVTRADFGGVVEVLADALPPGITMDARPTEGNFNVLPVVFSAAADAELAGGLVDLRARLVSEEQKIEGRFTNFADFVNGEPNQAVYYGVTVDRLPVAVTSKAPFSIEITAPTAPLVRDGSCNIHVVATRDEGFTAPINLRFPFRPPGLGTSYQITIPEGQTEIDYTINANANAQIGTWPVFVVGFAGVDGGNLWVSSSLADLKIAEPFVRIEAGRSATDQGTVAQVLCTVEQVVAFDGEAKVELLGLPPGATAETKMIKADTTQIVFDVTTTGECPVGNHKSLFCQVSLPFSADTSLAVTGRTELQITQPAAPVVAAAEAAAPAAPAPPAEKPLSRLEKLRAMSRSPGTGENRN